MTDKHLHFDSFNAGREWGTPGWIWGPLYGALRGFDLDPASGAERSRIARDTITKYDDPGGLEAEWQGDVWLNWPYDRWENPKWARKVREEIEAGNPHTITVLCPNSTTTDWWHDTYADADYLTFIDKRVKFYDGEAKEYRDSASFGSVVASFEVQRCFPDDYIDALHDLGDVRPAP